MKIKIIGGSGFVGTRLIDLLRDFPAVSLLNIDKQQSWKYPEITRIANVLDVEKLTALLAGADVVVLLAAEHKDNVSPASLYYDINVGGMRNTLAAMEQNGITRLIFTSSVAVYGLNKNNPSEESPADPFNDYGCSKWQAECVLKSWHEEHPDWNINVVRPTVIFGEGNRGNVYNLLLQIASGKFLMIGKGYNRKSMAYVGNVVAFISFLIWEGKDGYKVFNYVDKPDFTMNELVDHAGIVLNKHIPVTRIPYWLGMAGGYCFDILAKVTGRKLTISSVRVKKFCAVTQYETSKETTSCFHPVCSLGEGLARTLSYEFGGNKND